MDERRSFEICFSFYGLVGVLGSEERGENDIRGVMFREACVVRRSMMVLMPYSSFNRLRSDIVASSALISAVETQYLECELTRTR